jgi:hypothetical protein
VFGEDAYQTIHEKAAALLASLVNNRALSMATSGAVG